MNHLLIADIRQVFPDNLLIVRRNVYNRLTGNTWGDILQSEIIPIFPRTEASGEFIFNNCS